MRQADDCDTSGCVLASAFFPDAGRHKLVLYPKMFTQDREEQLETLIHEIGHVFGLRHFFAQLSETAWRSEIFGKHKKFSIMNYGGDSKLSDDDRGDLKKLYQMAWAGELTQINGTPIKFMNPSTRPIATEAASELNCTGPRSADVSIDFPFGELSTCLLERSILASTPTHPKVTRAKRGTSMEPEELTGYYTYRSFLNKVGRL